MKRSVVANARKEECELTFLLETSCKLDLYRSNQSHFVSRKRFLGLPCNSLKTTREAKTTQRKVGRVGIALKDLLKGEQFEGYGHPIIRVEVLK